MQEKLIFATRNVNKVKEIGALLNHMELLSLQEVGITDDIPEEEPTLEGNAIFKAKFVFEKIDNNAFADDTGLEVEALNGLPGVHSARYAGEEKNDKANIDKLLKELSRHENRNARFKTVIALYYQNHLRTFEGICEGEIALEPIGDKGFGYDSIFIPRGYKKTFAQLEFVEKNRISHRAIAVKKMVEFLKTVY